jgi:adenylate cyclase
LSQLSKAIIWGVFIGSCGLVVSFIPIFHELEENLGLDLLFSLRGSRQAPQDVIIVSLDTTSFDKLNLPRDADKFPHSRHAEVVNTLAGEGAKVIAFDIFFNESLPTNDDRLFADSIRNAGNIVLVQSIKSEKRILRDEKGSPAGEIRIEKLAPPISPLLESAAAVAPFPLPKVPVKISQYWTFKTTAGDTPTLPVTVYQLYTIDYYEEFMRLLDKFIPSETENLPHSKDDLMNNRNVVTVMRSLRDIFENNPAIANDILEDLSSPNKFTSDSHKRAGLKSLIYMYLSGTSKYLNFYGPPHSIKTVPYYRVLQAGNKTVNNQDTINFKNKAVFIGEAEAFQPEQSDGYYTVFSQSSGTDISGVEIAATAFANLLENMHVMPLSLSRHLILIFFWGMVLGIICLFFGNLITVISVIGITALYTVIAMHQFTTTGIWFPIVVPLFLLLPLSVIGSFAWKYRETNKDRQNVRMAFSYYLPDNVIDNISNNITDIKMSSQVSSAIILSTDAEQYTRLSEAFRKEPDKLGSFMNKYFEVIFQTIKQYDGVISNVVADSVLALWLHPDSSLRRQASLASLDIVRAVDRFNQSLKFDDSLKEVQLPTRIGLHYGEIYLGNIGGVGRYEWRPMGDPVNTATRIEGLNKLLGTRILFSDEVLNQVNGFLSRKLGTFLVKGKSESLVVHELICLKEECTQRQTDMCSIFSEALDDFTRQSWAKAVNKFKQIIHQFGEDGPSDYYRKLSEIYIENPPEFSGDAVIRLNN